MTEDHREVRPRRLVARGEIAGPKAGAGREIDGNVAGVAQTRRKIVGVANEARGDLEDHSPRLRLTYRLNEGRPEGREHSGNRLGRDTPRMWFDHRRTTEDPS